MTNYENDPGQSGSYQPWPGQTASNAAQPYAGPPQQEPGQYPTQYQQPQYQQAQYQQPAYQPQYQPYQGGQYPYQPPSNGLGTGGFVCGLLGLVLFWIPFLGLVLAVVGIALSGAGMSAGKRTGASTGLAVAGLVLGIIAVVPGVSWLIFAANV